MRRSALRQHGQSSRRGPAKSVQWVSDIKKKPQEISSDRKIVKVQVLLLHVVSFFIRHQVVSRTTIKIRGLHVVDVICESNLGTTVHAMKVKKITFLDSLPFFDYLVLRWSITTYLISIFFYYLLQPLVENCLSF